MPRFSRSCLVDAPIPPGHETSIFAPGPMRCSTALRTRAEQTASGSAFWWQKRTTFSAFVVFETRDLSRLFHGFLLPVPFRSDCLSVR